MFKRSQRYILPALALLALDAVPALAAGGHSDPVSPVLVMLLVILAAAKIGGEIFERLHQPAVLGELLAGVAIGNAYLLFGDGQFEMILAMTHHGGPVDIMSRIGVILLLFAVGLESNVQDMMKVGPSSLLVAIVGVVAPFAMGYFLAEWLGFGEQVAAHFAEMNFTVNPHNVSLFAGATMTATSVGITARVFKDMGKLDLKEARIILGAAVLDDVIGLIILAVVAGIITASADGGTLHFSEVVIITGKAVAFLLAAVLAGGWIATHSMRWFARLRVGGLMTVTSLAFCFLLAWLANLIGLAPIVGAFAAGLVLDPVHFRDFKDRSHFGNEIHIDDLIRPLSDFFVPLFFVLMGIGVALETLTDPETLLMGVILTAAALIGKLACGLGVVEKGVGRMMVGVGMIPRGEVGLIFAAIGKSLHVVDDGLYSAFVMMVIITTLVTPPLLKVLIDRQLRAAPAGKT